MKVVITGGCGFIGSSLCKTLLAKGNLKGPDGNQIEISKIVLYDSTVPDAPYVHELRSNPKVSTLEGDITDRNSVETAISIENYQCLSVFHLASILSGPGERNFDLCMRVNLDGTRHILEAMRAIHTRINVPQKIVFTSTNAVFAPTNMIYDDTPTLPQTTYGMTKIICEKMINDYTRKGFIIGAGARLPSVLIRPEANTAASNCFNAVMREPLRGVNYKCPVPLSVRHPITSKKNVINCIVALHEVDSRLLGIDKVVLLPAKTYTLSEMFQAAKRLADRVGLENFGTVTEEINDADYNIVKDWPPEVIYKRAKDLHLPEEIDIDEIVEDFYKNFIKK